MAGTCTRTPQSRFPGTTQNSLRNRKLKTRPHSIPHRLWSPESEEILAETAEVLYQVFGECSPPDRRTPDHASVRRWLSGLTGDDWNRDQPVTSPPHTSTTPLEITPRTVTPPPSSPDKPAGRVTRARTRARKAKKKINFID